METSDRAFQGAKLPSQYQPTFLPGNEQHMGIGLSKIYKDNCEFPKRDKVTPLFNALYLSMKITMYLHNRSFLLHL